MTDINARIAEKKGWTYERCVVCNGKHWYDNVKYIQKNPPSYTTDWRLAGELLEELYEQNLHISLTFRNKANVDVDYSHGHYDNNRCDCRIGDRSHLADTPQMAICLAWLEWSEG